MSLYTPVFPSAPDLPVRSRSHSPPISSASPAPHSIYAYTDRLRDVHLFLSTKNEVLSPSSRPSTPSFEVKVDALRAKAKEAFDLAGGDTTHGKWTHVRDSLKLGCIHGRYLCRRRDVQLLDKGVQWILPDTEAAWCSWSKDKGATNTVSQGTALQDSFSHLQAEQMEEEAPRILGKRRAKEAFGPHAERPTDTVLDLKEKIKSWRVNVGTDKAIRTDGSSAPLAVRSKLSRHHPAGQKEAVLDHDGGSRLSFPVVKRATMEGAKSSQESAISRKVDVSFSSRAQPDILISAVGRTNADALPESSSGFGGVTDMPRTNAQVINAATVDLPTIVDLSEMAYIPPSFPSHLGTSTPPLSKERSAKGPRRKPSPIIARPSAPLFASLPDIEDTHKRDKVSLQRNDFVPAQLTSSLPHGTSGMRQNPTTPPAALSTLLASTSSRRTPPPKKARFHPSPGEIDMARHSTPPVNVPPSPNADGKDSGNALSPLSAATPDHRIPTLVELLTVSRRSKLRPRLTSRKAQSRQRSAEREDQSPRQKGREMRENQLLPQISYLESSALDDYRPFPVSRKFDTQSALLRPPDSPMFAFTQDPDAFLPLSTSSQRRVSEDEPKLARTSSGFYGEGYSSQFDVEKQVDMVNEVLERDVDFEGWLKDVPTVEDSSLHT